MSAADALIDALAGDAVITRHDDDEDVPTRILCFLGQCERDDCSDQEPPEIIAARNAPTWPDPSARRREYPVPVDIVVACIDAIDAASPNPYAHVMGVLRAMICEPQIDDAVARMHRRVAERAASR